MGSQAFSLTIPAGHKLGGCCDETATRYALSGGVVVSAPSASSGEDLTRGYVMATNGRCLAVLPVVLGDDKGGKLAGPIAPALVPRESLDAPAKHDAAVFVNGEVRQTSRGTRGAVKMAVHPLPLQEGRFPPVGDVFPPIEGATLLTIDVKYLVKLAAAIAPSGILTLVIPADGVHDGRINKALGAVGEENESCTGLGVLMPLTYDRKEHNKTVRDYYALHAAAMPRTSVLLGETPATLHKKQIELPRGQCDVCGDSPAVSAEVTQAGPVAVCARCDGQASGAVDLDGAPACAECAEVLSQNNLLAV